MRFRVDKNASIKLPYTKTAEKIGYIYPLLGLVLSDNVRYKVKRRKGKYTPVSDC